MVPTNRLAAFLESAPRGSLRVLAALSAAESLSDWLARSLVELVCPGQEKLQSLVPALHLAGFLVERNSEWHLSQMEREFLLQELSSKPDLYSLCHAHLAAIANTPTADNAEVEVPTYLLNP